ncbi:MAG: glycosyltransferase family 2 protein [Firmicutes bacterium]|nr:glycosyltransferase family 2 protein [Bacillota bacterium]
MKKILVFIPMYNCEKQISRVLDQFDEEVIEYLHDIICVNNRSNDNTEEVVLEYKDKHPNLNIKLLRNEQNYNLGGSHKVAFDYAIKNNYDYVVVLHGDDQGDIHDLMPVLTSGDYENYDCMLGARFMKGSKLIGYSKFRTFGNRVYNILFSIVVRKRIYDLGSGLNMYNVGMLENKFYYQFPDRLTFNYCMILASHFYKHNISFFPISWREDDQVSNVKMMNQALNVLKMLFKYLLNHKYITKEFRDNVVLEYKASEIKVRKNEN